MPKPKEQRNYELDHKLNLKTEDLTFEVHNYDVDIKSNHIYLFGVDRGYELESDPHEPGVDYVLSNRFIRNFNLCMRKNPNTPILIHMKTCGGDWTEGMAIYDTIRSCPWPVTILNYTHARSMSSLIFQAGNKKIMMPHSYFMFHEGTLGLEGTTKQVRSAIQFDKRSSTDMINIYTKSMKERGLFVSKPEAYIKNWIRTQMDKKEDVYLSAQEAVKYGLADEIFDYNWKELTEYTKEQLER